MFNVNPNAIIFHGLAKPEGGLHDIGPNARISGAKFWSPPHQTHNDGKNVDIGFDTLSPYVEGGHTDDALKLLRYIINDPLFEVFGATNEGKDMSICNTQIPNTNPPRYYECNHYHVTFRNTPKPAGSRTATLTINTIPAMEPSKPIAVSGILEDTITSAPIAGATINFASTNGTTATPGSVTTAADGKFSTTATTVNVEGKYNLRAQFPGNGIYKLISAAKTYYVDTTKPTVSVTSPG